MILRRKMETPSEAQQRPWLVKKRGRDNMKIDWKATLAGVSIKDVRDALTSLPISSDNPACRVFEVYHLARELLQQAWRKHVDEEIKQGKYRRSLRRYLLQDGNGKPDVTEYIPTAE